jgi:hypothetical protein
MVETKVIFKDAGHVFAIRIVPAEAGVAASRGIGRAIMDWAQNADEDMTIEIHSGVDLVAVTR